MSEGLITSTDPNALVKIEFDAQNSPISPTIVLATRSGKKLGTLPAYDVNFKDALGSYSELTFSVDKYDNGVECELWDQITNLRAIWCPEWDHWFEMSVSIDEGNEMRKNIEAISLGEAELSQINLYSCEINTETDIERDDYPGLATLYNDADPSRSIIHRVLSLAPHFTVRTMASGISSLSDEFSFDDCSIYDALLEISEKFDCFFVVDSSSDENGQPKREIVLYDFENTCLDCGTRGKFIDNCLNCGSTNLAFGSGEDTTIFVSAENLADSISLEINKDDIKNCIKLDAGDEFMADTIRLCEPSGEGFLIYFTDEMKADMSDKLANCLTSYREDYDEILNEHVWADVYGGANGAAYLQTVAKYKPYAYNRDYPTALQLAANPSVYYKKENGEYVRCTASTVYSAQDEYYTNLLEMPVDTSRIVGFLNLVPAYYTAIDLEYLIRDTMMPTPTLDETSAGTQALLLANSSGSYVGVRNLEYLSKYTADSTVLSVAKTIIDSSRYKLEIRSSSYDEGSTNWTGSFEITSYSDEDDSATSGYISFVLTEDSATITKQKLDKILLDDDYELSGTYSVKYIFDIESDADFRAELNKYCLERLTSFYDAAEACVSMIDELLESETVGQETLSELRSKYVTRMGYISAVIQDREEDLDCVLDFEERIIDDYITPVRDEFNTYNYILDETGSEDYYNEFCAFRRESTYKDDNTISDGLSNLELCEKAKTFFKKAWLDLKQATKGTMTISTTLANLLVCRDFAPLTSYFRVGNMVRVQVDDFVYRLRLLDYQIDFEQLDNLAVTLSEETTLEKGFILGSSIASGSITPSKLTGSISAAQLGNAVSAINNYSTGKISCDKISVRDGFITNAMIGDLNASKITSGYIGTDILATNVINAINANVDRASIDSAIITSLDAGKIDVNTIQADLSDALLAHASNGVITNALIDSVSASKITAGAINTGNITVESMIQWLDGDDNVRMQAGQDAGGNYNFAVFGADGSTAYFDENGLHSAGVPDGILVDRMVANSDAIYTVCDAGDTYDSSLQYYELQNGSYVKASPTLAEFESAPENYYTCSGYRGIGADKLDIDGFFEILNNDGSRTIKSSSILYDGENQTLDVFFNSLTESIDGKADETEVTQLSIAQGELSSLIAQINNNYVSTSVLQQTVDEIRSEISQTSSTNYSITVTSGAGLVFSGEDIETVLTAHVFRNGVELTVAEINELGTLKWYTMNQSTGELITPSVGTGRIFSVDSGSSMITYTVQLEE